VRTLFAVGALSLLTALPPQRPAPVYDVAYVQKETSGYSSESGVYLRRIDGGASIRVALERSIVLPANGWSPDGARLVFQAMRLADEPLSDRCPGYSNRPLYMTDVARLERTGEAAAPERMTDLLVGEGLSWSPDGQTIAFASVCEDPKRQPGRDPALSAVYLLDVATRKVERITEWSFRWPSWSPDGKRIVVDGMEPGATSPEMGIHVMDADGRNRKRIADGIRPVWSPTGDRIAYIRGSTLLVMSPDGTERRSLEQLPTSIDFEWSRDGRSLLVASRFILVIDAATGAKINLGAPAMDHRFSSEGSSVLVSRMAGVTAMEFGVTPPASTKVLDADKGQRLDFGLAVRPRR
jgi:Tol biopolymer transport system component